MDLARSSPWPGYNGSTYCGTDPDLSSTRPGNMGGRTPGMPAPANSSKDSL